MNAVRLALATAAALAVLPSTAAFAQAPQNDHYLQSLPMNAPGTRVPTDAQRHSVDTTAATEQSDLFNPQPDGSAGSGGPAETLTCRIGASTSTFGKTVWYDVYPHVDGLLQVQAAATFDSVISVVPFDRTLRPDYGEQQCADSDSGPTEELFATLRRGRSYTIQIGGFNAGAGPAGGQLQNTFSFFPDTDGDGQLDGTDRCRTRPGDVNGCPRRLDRTVRAPFRWTAAPGGVVLRSLKVDAPRGARVVVTCSQRACRRISRRASTGPRAQAARTIRLITNRRFRAGTRIDVRVTQPTAVGALIRHTVGVGTFTQRRFCLNPGSTRPRTRCR